MKFSLIFLLLNFLLPAVLGAGVISLSSDVYYSSVDQLVVPINIIRSGSSEGQISINATTADLTAISPTDYTGVAGGITWPAGDSLTRQVQLTVNSAAVGNRSKSFRFLITGIDGGTLGQPSSAIIFINGRNFSTNETNQKLQSSSSSSTGSAIVQLSPSPVSDSDDSNRNLGLGLGLGLGGGILILSAIIAAFYFRKRRNQGNNSGRGFNAPRASDYQTARQGSEMAERNIAIS